MNALSLVLFLMQMWDTLLTLQLIRTWCYFNMLALLTFILPPFCSHINYFITMWCITLLSHLTPIHTYKTKPLEYSHSILYYYRSSASLVRHSVRMPSITHLLKYNLATMLFMSVNHLYTMTHIFHCSWHLSHYICQKIYNALTSYNKCCS